MANGDPLLPGRSAGSEDYVIRSGVRSGLKREFAFALKAQAELPSSLGRTRSRKAAPLSCPPGFDIKKMKRSGGEDEPSQKRSGSVVLEPVENPMVVDGPDVPKKGSTLDALIVIDGLEGSDGSTISELEVNLENPTVMASSVPLPLHAGSAADAPIVIDCHDGVEVTKGNGGLSIEEPDVVEVWEPKKIGLSKVPSNVGELLETGLLEGLSVKYISGTDKEVWLQGLIQGGGILCNCNSCKGSKVVSAYQFEQHACSSKKHPSDFICLENGSRIQDVLEACKDSPFSMVESSIWNAIGLVPTKKNSICQKCKELFHTSSTGRFTLLCDSCLELDQPQTNPSTPDGTDIQARLSPPVLVQDSSDKTSKSTSSQKKVKFGRLTKKDLGLHKLVFMSNISLDGAEVGYFVRGERILVGSIKGSGILCRCCKSVVSPSQFEAHAGQAQRRKPYNNIYVSNGVSLHELSVSLSKTRKLSESENDDLCSICADGGDLLLCDLCPRAFHRDCVGLSSIPTGEWYCRYCQNMLQREKCVEYNSNAVAAGRVAGVDPIEQIFKRSIRIFKTPETKVGGCVFCRKHDHTKRFGPRTVLLCDQCEREHHIACLKAHNIADFKKLPVGKWFCCADCSRIHTALQELVLHGAQPLSNLDSGIIKNKHAERGLEEENVDVKWSLLSGETCKATGCNKLLLSEAVSVFHESFDPIIASRGDLIPSLVYGRQHSDEHDFRGMYCAVLTVGSSVVSAGILRVLGCEVAELPLVATSRERQGLGYFQSLFLCIERLLRTLNVKHFVLPAAEEAVSIWTKKFGFTKITTDELYEFTKGAKTMVFEGTSMLHKLVPSGLEASLEGSQGS